MRFYIKISHFFINFTFISTVFQLLVCAQSSLSIKLFQYSRISKCYSDTVHFHVFFSSDDSYVVCNYNAVLLKNVSHLEEKYIHKQ